MLTARIPASFDEVVRNTLVDTDFALNKYFVENPNGRRVGEESGTLY